MTLEEGTDVPGIIENAVLAAGAEVVRISEAVGSGFSRDFVKAWRKDDDTLVTSLDLACDRLLREKLTPYLPVLTEEDESTHSNLNSSGSYCLLDPIDGTTASRRFLTATGGQVGFGLLAGLVVEGQLMAASFYNVPHRSLFSARKDQGLTVVRDIVWENPLPSFEERPKIRVTGAQPLAQCSILFYVSGLGEAKVIEQLKQGGHIESFSRYGGFANDATRVSLGFEDIQIQFAVKPWDFSAMLFPHEAGLSVILDPLGSAMTFEKWKVQKNNPVVVAPHHLVQSILGLIRG